METDTKERTSVVMLRGHGESRLKQAIMQGLVREDLQEDVAEVLRRCEELERDLAIATKRNRQLESELQRFKGIFHSAVLEVQKKDLQRRRLSSAGYLAAIAFSAFLIILACMMICRAVFG